MFTFHNYVSIFSGLLLILSAITILLFPPKFGNFFYGICTKLTMKNKASWYAGQKFFAVAIFITGIIFLVLGGLKIDDNIPQFAMFAILFICWFLSKIIVHKILAGKFAASDKK
jgi:uncharacterized membrane protein